MSFSRSYKFVVKIKGIISFSYSYSVYFVHNIYFVSAKLASVLNPIVYAVSHPKYREALAREVPCLGIGTYKQFV